MLPLGIFPVAGALFAAFEQGKTTAHQQQFCNQHISK